MYNKYLNQMYNNAVFRLRLVKAGEDVTKPPTGCHRVRATTISELSAAGVNLTTISKLSGHKQIQSMLSYNALRNVFLKNCDGLSEKHLNEGGGGVQTHRNSTFAYNSIIINRYFTDQITRQQKIILADFEP